MAAAEWLAALVGSAAALCLCGVAAVQQGLETCCGQRHSMLRGAMALRAERSQAVTAAFLVPRSMGARLSGTATVSDNSAASALRLYRSLLRAQRQFPVDEKRAATGRDMRSQLHRRIRSAFEQSRDASGAQVRHLMQTGETELHALRTIGTNHFATEVRPLPLSPYTMSLRSPSPLPHQYPSQMGNHGATRPESDSAGVSFQIFGRFWKS